MTLLSEPFTLTPPEPEDVYSFALGHPDDAAYYVLDPKRRVVPATQERFEAMPDDEKIVGETKIGDTTIATEFLGYDNSGGDEGEPLVFQTFIRTLQGEQAGECFATWAEAAADHRRTVELYKRAEQRH